MEHNAQASNLYSCSLNKKIPDYMFAGSDNPAGKPQDNSSDSFFSNAITDIADFLGK